MNSNFQKINNFTENNSYFSINRDSNPCIINKKTNKELVYKQELAVRYLRPPVLPQPGYILIKQSVGILPPPPPPLIIRQQPCKPSTPLPLIVRERPPTPPRPILRKVITISGKRLPPPPRKVIIERLPKLPPKPQAIITERWLPYPQQQQSAVKRRVILQRPPPQPVYCKPKNVIVQWSEPEVVIKQKIHFLGVIKADPVDYIQKYNGSLIQSKDLPQICTSLPVANGYVLAADYLGNNNNNNYNNNDFANQLPELEGDLEALKLIDLESVGLGMYKHVLNSISK